MNQNEQQPERTAIAARIDQKSSVILSGAAKNTPIIENNEDNRRHTVIAAEIERQKTILSQETSKLSDQSGMTYRHIVVYGIERTISVLESLLPKEREMIMCAFVSGDRYENDSEQWFSQTYTQDYKTK